MNIQLIEAATTDDGEIRFLESYNTTLIIRKGAIYVSYRRLVIGDI